MNKVNQVYGVLLGVVLLGSSAWAQRSAGPVAGSGTVGQIPIWTAPNTLGNSVISQVNGGIQVTAASSPITGTSTATTGFAAGISGNSGSSGGFGVWGSNFATSGSGGAGVGGFSSASTGLVWGVLGAVDSNPPNPDAVGIQAGGYNAFRAFSQTCPSLPCTPLPGTAGYFATGEGGNILVGSNATSNAVVFLVDSSGNLTISGNLSKASGSFKIDHPLYPAEKYLSHSFVESPDMMNIYNGNVITDREGMATVILPDYFEALNRDFRYQLTVIGQFAQAIVANEIENNRFVIKTDRPGVKVSWQVTGIRHDAFANTHRIKVEENKPPEQVGHYLHPELYGQPFSKSVREVARPSRLNLRIDDHEVAAGN